MASEPESLFDEIDEDAVEAMDSLDDLAGMDSVDDLAEMDSIDEIGETSQPAAETMQPAGEEPSARSSRFGFLKSLSIYEAMLIASAVAILIACTLLFFELSTFGGPFFQWRTSEAFVEPLTPP